MLTISLRDLRKLRACEAQIALFISTFGEDAIVENTRENLDKAYRFGLDLPRLAARKSRGGAYHAECAALWDAYNAACEPHEAARIAEQSALWEACAAACKPHEAARDAEQIALLEAYRVACASAARIAKQWEAVNAEGAARHAYHDARKRCSDVCDAATKPHWEAQNEARKRSGDAFRAACKPHWEAYHEARKRLAIEVLAAL